MRRDLRRAKLLMGRALLKSYKEDWLPHKEKVDRMIENIVLSSHWIDSVIVQGSDRLTAQERLIAIKESDRDYRTLVRRIEKMARILDGLSDEQRAIVDCHHWRGIPWYEIARQLSKSKQTFYDHVYRIEEHVGSEWNGEDEDDFYTRR